MAAYRFLCIFLGSLCFAVVTVFGCAMQLPIRVEVLFQVHLLLSFHGD